jgi:hypothetical protein
MKWILSLIVLFCSCEIHFSRDVVISKIFDPNLSKQFGEPTCLYFVGSTISERFSAPCYCYEVGDSINKWYKNGSSENKN